MDKYVIKFRKDKNSGQHSLQCLKIRSLVTKALCYIGQGNSKLKETGDYIVSFISKKLDNLDTTIDMSEAEFHKLIGGDKIHSSNTEPFFWETAYHTVSQEKVLQISEKGIVSNTFEIPSDVTDLSKIKYWGCSNHCNIRLESIKAAVEIFKKISNLKQIDFFLYFKNLDNCKSPKHGLKGHPVSCISSESCTSIIRVLRELSVHYPALRKFIHKLYFGQNLVTSITLLRKFLNSGNKDKLEKQLNIMEALFIDRYKETNPEKFHREPGCTDQTLLNDFGREIQKFEERKYDFPEFPCICCERLYQEYYVKNWVIFQEKNTDAWLQVLALPILLDYYDSDHEYFVCNYCVPFLEKNIIPGRSILNDLFTDPVPDILSDLNIYEWFLLQRAKAFQMVVRLGTKSGNIPKSALVKAIKGRIVYLPLPVKHNIDMLPDNFEPQNNDYLVILVNGQPTKSKVVWQNIVDISKIKKALLWLKENNFLYRNFTIKDCVAPETTENVKSHPEVEIPLLKTSSKTSLERVDKQKEEEIVQQFTVHPLFATKLETDLELYQMKKTTADPLSSWDEELDIQCFPDIFPTGRYGKYSANRKIYLKDSEYRKSRLLSKHPRYRLNQQYLFHLFHDSEVKNLESAVFHYLRMRKNAKNLNVSEILSRMKMKDSDIELNLSSFRTNINGTKEFWDKRRRELTAMIGEHGTPTFFVTLSSAEFGWEELHTHLLESNKDVPGIHSMTTGELCALDPVTVSKHFHRRYNAFFHSVLKSKYNPPLGEVENFFWRVEYQSRAAAHIHMVLWIKDAPVIGVDSPEKILAFIQKYITCEKPDPAKSPELASLVDRFQTHKCNSTCIRTVKKKEKLYKKCRFKFPRQACNKAKLNNLYSSIRHHLNSKSSKRPYEIPRRQDEI